MSTTEASNAAAAAPPATPMANRIVSMDQFRGYTVAGMFLVNFLGAYKQTVYPVLLHKDNFISYADTIMPSFMFACGFSYRLSTLRRIETKGSGAAYLHAIIRSLALILISLMVYGFGSEFKSFNDISAKSVYEFIAKVLKADMWETLAIIGAAQLLILPVVASGKFVRLFTIALFLVTHGVITHYFNYDFMEGKPNLLTPYWGLATSRTWDGGFFGVMMWSVPMLAGSLAYDAMRDSSPGKASFKLMFWGCLLMIVGYGISCLTRLYDVTPEALAASTAAQEKVTAAKATLDAAKKANDEAKTKEAQAALDAATAEADKAKVGPHAASPVVFDLAKLQAKANAEHWKELLAEPPFIEGADVSKRQYNYWLMRKRIVSPSFTIFATGFGLALLAVFVIFIDGAGLRIPLFRTLGTNALAAYVIHGKVEETIHSIVPKDSPIWYVLVGLVVFYIISYGFVRWLEAQKVFIRL